MNWLWFFFSFKGRIARKPYWIFMLVTAFIGLFVGIAVRFFEFIDSELIVGIFAFLVFWPLFAITAKRWHDRNRSAWWFLFVVLPVAWLDNLVQLWILIECAFLPGTPSENRFGPVQSKRPAAAGKADRYQRVLIVSLITFFVLGTLFLGYSIPSGGMMPALLIGDFIAVSRISYGIPVPFAHQEIISLSNPKRGDVVVFRFPKELSITYIKRIVGVPGDEIRYRDKTLHINGEVASQTPLGDYLGSGSGLSMSGVDLRREDLGGYKHEMLVDPKLPDYKCEPYSSLAVGRRLKIPEGSFFVMGDNRDYSNDSRCWGFVPRDYVIGRPLMIWMHWDDMREGFPIDWSRAGQLVR